MLVLRKALFYIFLGIYFICCPLTVLYALGYIVKPGSELGLVKTGIIYLSTAPPGASVYLENRHFTKKTPAVLSGLLPGRYSVRIRLKNHQSWTQTVPVEAERATVLERILLLPAGLKSTTVHPGPFKRLIPIEGHHFFLVVKGDRLGGLFLYDWKQEKIQPFLAPGALYENARILSYVAVAKSPNLFFHVQAEEGEKYVWLEHRGRGAQVTDVTRFFPVRPSMVVWDPAKEGRIFSIQEGRLSWFDADARSSVLKWMPETRGFGLHDKMIYVLKPDGEFVRMDPVGENWESILKDPLLSRELFGKKGFFDISIFSKDAILFRGEDGELLANRLPYRFASEGVRGLGWDSRKNQVLVWTKEKIGVLRLSREHEEEKGFERGPELMWAYGQAKKIEQAFWVYEDSHVLFRDAGHLRLLELETYGTPHLYELGSAKRKTAIFYSEESGKVYYLDSGSGALESLEILPRRELLLLPFPERKEKRKAALFEGLP